MRDAFAGSAVPQSMVGRAFAQQCARRVTAAGIVLFNISDRPPHEDLRGEIAAMREHFANVAVVAEPGQFKGRRWGNVVLAASHSRLDAIAIAQVLRRGPASAALRSGLELDAYAGVPRVTKS